MHNILKKIAVITSDLEHIHRTRFAHRRPWRITFDYLRLRIKASLNRWMHFKKEHFLSYVVEFPDYEVFFVEFRQIFVRHAYHFKTTDTKPIVVDCGGNIGMSVLYFKYLYPQATITVFEPSHEVLASIQRNISVNNLSDVYLIKKAVAAHDGTATMHSRGSAACGNTLSTSLASDTKKEKSTGESYEVPTTRLSPYITSHTNMLKLDIEGSEGDVIEELKITNSLKHVETIVMEYHPHTDPHENSLTGIITTLQGSAWQLELFSEDDVTAHSLSIRTLTKKT